MRIEKLAISLLCIGLAALSACQRGNRDCKALDYEALNKQAAEEYTEPIRPGYEGKNPYWNEFAVKFIYAPAFDFKSVEGASYYQFTVTPQDNKSQKSWVMTAKSPNESLAPIWNDIEVGNVVLKVEAMDKEGKVIESVAERTFLRDFPFSGPYHQPVREYKEAAVLALLGIHNMSAIQNWKRGTEPDMSYRLNTYACKIIGSTIRLEVLLAKLRPELKEEATLIAENAAQFLINQSHSEDAPLAYFPPTYYLNYITSGASFNKGKTMAMEALTPAHAMLDLYDLTGKKEYFERAIKITETYARLQAEDGSFPVKMDYESGEPVNNMKSMLHPLLVYLQRLESQYNVTTFAAMREKAEQYMQKTIMERFEMIGQFEDVNVLGIKPYENLTNCTAAPYASYLLSKTTISKQEVNDAIDMLRFSEDQFVHWDVLPGKHNVKRFFTPCVVEQYKFRTPVDASACNVANGWLSLYENTGDELYFAKAKAMIDNITITQNVNTGMIPTFWCLRIDPDWINCTYSSITTLLRMDSMINEQSK